MRTSYLEAPLCEFGSEGKLTEGVGVHPECKRVDLPRVFDLARGLEEGGGVRGDRSCGAEEQNSGCLWLRLRGVLQEDAAVIPGIGYVIHGSIVHLKIFSPLVTEAGKNSYFSIICCEESTLISQNFGDMYCILINPMCEVPICFHLCSINAIFCLQTMCQE